MTVREVVYSCLDLAKAATSDDSFFTEEHVIFLCKKYRSFLIKKEQEKKESANDESPESEVQQICLNLEKVPAMDGEPCTGGYYLRTEEKIPTLMDGTQPRVYPYDFYQGINICFISKDRMRYVGTNPYLQNIIYVSQGTDGHLYMNSSNSQFLYLKQIRMSAVFEDFEEAAHLLCDDECNCTPCDVLDMEFPIRDHLVPPLIELIVKQLTGSTYKSQDWRNNASDDLPKMANRQ